MSLSVTLPAKKFQLFHPIGGVAATVCAAACAPTPTAVTARKRASLPAFAIAERTRIPSLPKVLTNLIASPGGAQIIPQARHER
jgi:hypothetical protein